MCPKRRDIKARPDSPLDPAQQPESWLLAEEELPAGMLGEGIYARKPKKSV